MIDNKNIQVNEQFSVSDEHFPILMKHLGSFSSTMHQVDSFKDELKQTKELAKPSPQTVEGEGEDLMGMEIGNNNPSTEIPKSNHDNMALLHDEFDIMGSNLQT